MSLEFKDIKDWSPASISIVDAPAHPLAIFEVYENDEEFIKKYKPNEVNTMSENNNDEIKMPSSVFEKLLGPLIMKSDNTQKSDSNSELENLKTELKKVKEENTNLKANVNDLQEQLKKQEDDNSGGNSDESKKEKDIEEIVDKAIKKYLDKQEDNSEDNSDNDDDSNNSDDNDNNNEDSNENNEGSEDNTNNEPKDPKDPIVDDDKFIKKSKGLDPDTLKHSRSEKTFMERIGRTNDGMKW